VTCPGRVHTGRPLMAAYIQGLTLTFAYIQGLALTFAYIQGLALTFAYIQGLALTFACIQRVPPAGQGLAATSCARRAELPAA
jgi:hypothetical protein